MNQLGAMRISYGQVNKPVTILDFVDENSFSFDNPFEINPESRLACKVMENSGASSAMNSDDAVAAFDAYVKSLWLTLFVRWIFVVANEVQ